MARPNYNSIPALPFSRGHNTVALPKPDSYPKELKTIGDYIRAWRINNHLLQADVAKILGVCEDTIVGWEMRETIPTVRQMPGIIKMLKYLPLQIDTSTLGGQIFHYRFLNGLGPEEVGMLISVNASTIREWEKGRHFPSKRNMVRIRRLLNTWMEAKSD
jgi:DNA-binding transcriptional regulator YiaG